MTGINRVRQLDARTFRRRYFRPKRPVLVRGGASGWPAMESWSFARLRDMAPEAEVLTERGNVLQGETDMALRPLRRYIDALIAGELDNTPADQREYLSLLDLFGLLPQLRRDVDFSLIESVTMRQQIFGWLGPGGTLTGYHIDWIDNTLAQIRGRKSVDLVAPEQSAGMYPTRRFSYRGTLSAIEPDEWDPVRHPRFTEVTPLRVELEPGDLLYIPLGWWHRVRALEPSLSVNAFGHDLRGLLRHQIPWLIRRQMHWAGLYRRASCTCHHFEDGRRVERTPY